jgi:hypothetical protein
LGGHSGCPVVVEQSIIALHIGAGAINEKFNIGRIISLTLLKDLEKWRIQLKGDSFTINSKMCFHAKA